MAIAEYEGMSINRRHAVAALAAAGLLWGTTVPLSKLALEWLSPGWLTVVRFGLAAAVLLAVARAQARGRSPPGQHCGRSPQSALRGRSRPRCWPPGALGYGGSVIVQNAGIARTSVTHAALLIGAVPVLVAIIAAAWYRTVAAPVAWFGFVVSLGGVGLVTVGGGGGGATLAGDGLVLVSLLLSATVTVAQGRLLAGRDPIAVTAVQFLGATLGALPVAVLTEGVPAMPHGAGPVLVVAALALAGTLAPFTLFAFGQSRVSAEVAGAFLNLEPLVGAIAGAVAFGDPVGLAQVAGGLAILAGIGLSSLPLIEGRRVVPARGHRHGHRLGYGRGPSPSPSPSPSPGAAPAEAPCHETATANAIVTVTATATAVLTTAPGVSTTPGAPATPGKAAAQTPGPQARVNGWSFLPDREGRGFQPLNFSWHSDGRNAAFMVVSRGKFSAGRPGAPGQARRVSQGGSAARSRPGGRAAERPPGRGRRRPPLGGRGRSRSFVSTGCYHDQN